MQVEIVRCKTKADLRHEKKIATEALKNIPQFKTPRMSKKAIKIAAAGPPVMEAPSVAPERVHAPPSRPASSRFSKEQLEKIKHQVDNFAYGVLSIPAPDPMRMREELETNPYISSYVEDTTEHVMGTVMAMNSMIGFAVNYGICYMNSKAPRIVRMPPAPVQDKNATKDDTPTVTVDDIPAVHVVSDSAELHSDEREAVGSGHQEPVDSQPNLHRPPSDCAQASGFVRFGPQEVQREPSGAGQGQV